MSSSLNTKIPLFKIKVEEKGRIKDIKEIVVRIDGLPSCLNGQIVDMGDGVKGIIMGYDEEDVLALVLGDPNKLRMGKEVRGISEPFEIPVGEAFISRMVTALGHPCDQRGDIESSERYAVFKESEPIIHRDPIDQPLLTGTKMIDMLIPIAKGQRQLILGDRMTGKTVVALDAIINQKGREMICIYCAIGKPMGALQKAVTTLKDQGALDYSILMVATDSAPVGEQYIVPYAAASMADYFAQKGKDVLVVFDDLTKHAWAYRQLSLLLERPPGREAYPGDIFYVQTQLMERAGRFNDKHGSGSVTFLGVAETLQGDVTGYIPSNLSSMCDGQVCMNSTTFAEGFRPAVDIDFSLSIVGGRTQPAIIKHLASSMRSDYARYNEVTKLSRLSTGLSGEAERVVKKGEAIMSVLQQGQFAPVSIAEQVLLLYAVDKELLLELSPEQRNKFCSEIFAFAEKGYRSLLDEVEDRLEMTPQIEKGLADVMKAYFAEAELKMPADG